MATVPICTVVWIFWKRRFFALSLDVKWACEICLLHFLTARLLQFFGLAYISILYFIFSNDLGFCQTVSKIANSLKSSSFPSSIPSLLLLWSSDSYWRAFKFLFISYLSLLYHLYVLVLLIIAHKMMGVDPMVLMWVGVSLSSESSEFSKEETSWSYLFLASLCLVLTTRNCSWVVFKLIPLKLNFSVEHRKYF